MFDDTERFDLVSGDTESDTETIADTKTASRECEYLRDAGPRASESYADTGPDTRTSAFAGG